MSPNVRPVFSYANASTRILTCGEERSEQERTNEKSIGVKRGVDKKPPLWHSSPLS